MEKKKFNIEDFKIKNVKQVTIKNARVLIREVINRKTKEKHFVATTVISYKGKTQKEVIEKMTA